ncbi:MAG: hypothetical protein PW734_06120 [Verrucomicrobium sp.]|nr:hypothetical protein [Verrucomicrobium sp.]
MKIHLLRLTEKNLALLHRLLGRADLKGHEVPDFVQLLQELRPVADEATSKSERG